MQLVDSDDEVTPQPPRSKRQNPPLHKSTKAKKRSTKSKTKDSQLAIIKVSKLSNQEGADAEKKSNKEEVQDSNVHSSVPPSVTSSSRSVSRSSRLRKKEKVQLVTKSVAHMLAMKYPKNKFKINLPSLEAETRAERRRVKGILKE